MNLKMIIRHKNDFYEDNDLLLHDNKCINFIFAIANERIKSFNSRTGNQRLYSFKAMQADLVKAVKGIYDNSEFSSRIIVYD